MQDVQDRINERKVRFIERIGARLQELETQLASDDIQNRRDLVAECRWLFHKIAGAAGIYDLTEFAQVAIEAENLASRLASSGIPADRDRDALRAYCIRLRQTLPLR